MGDAFEVVLKPLSFWDVGFMKTLTRHFLIPLCLSATTLSLQGALLAYDGFSSSVYNAIPSGSGGGYKDPSAGPSDALFFDNDTNFNNGSTEVGQGPGVLGFSGNWKNTTNISQTVYARLENSQLSYSGLTTTTGQLNLFRSGGSGAAKGFTRSLDVGPSTNFGSTLYIGGLIQRTSDTSFSLSINTTNGTDTRSFSMAIAGDGITTFTGTGATTTASDSPLWTAGAAQYFILKLENSIADGGASTTEGDRISLYINPDLSNEAGNSPAMVFEDANASFFVTGNSAWTLGELNISSGLTAAGQSVIFDEFAIATTWNDLLTIPEPSSSLLIAGSLLTACCLRTRRTAIFA